MKRSRVSYILVFLLLLFLCGTAAYGKDLQSFEAGNYLIDTAGILTEEERIALDEEAQRISETYSCGVYMVTVENYEDYDDRNVEVAAEAIYVAANLGIGEEKDGVLLLLSMADRDFDIDAYGFGNVAFTDYGKEKMQEKFLKNFKKNDWYGGFQSYLKTSDKYLKLARKGKPYDVSSSPLHVILSLASSLALGLIVAALVVMHMKEQMGKVELKEEAAEYIVKHGVTIETREDTYTRTTTTKKYSPRSSGKGGRSGGTSVGSSGHSHSSGKF